MSTSSNEQKVESMNKLPINGDLVGLSIDPISHSWTNRDTMLYALGIGCRPPDDLDFIYEGRGPKVVPTFAVIPGLRAMGSAMQRIDINLAALLHAADPELAAEPQVLDNDSDRDKVSMHHHEERILFATTMK